MKFEWEMIYQAQCDSKTWRAKVLGGWLIRHQCWSEQADDGATPVAVSITFLNDPDWDWEID